MTLRIYVRNNEKDYFALQLIEIIIKMKLDISNINEAFSPTHEINDPEKFVGRYEEIESLILGLSTESSFLSIFGLRGIGKSSIAKQIKLIAEGDETLPKLLSLNHLLPKKGFNFMVHLVCCDEFILMLNL